MKTIMKKRIRSIHKAGNIVMEEDKGTGKKIFFFFWKGGGAEEIIFTTSDYPLYIL
jgi:hypothetical protein